MISVFAFIFMYYVWFDTDSFYTSYIRTLPSELSTPLYWSPETFEYVIVTCPDVATRYDTYSFVTYIIFRIKSFTKYIYYMSPLSHTEL